MTRCWINWARTGIWDTGVIEHLTFFSSREAVAELIITRHWGRDILYLYFVNMLFLLKLFISLQSMFLHVHCLYRVILFLLVEKNRYLLAVTWLNYMQVVLGGGLVTKCSECLYASEFRNTGSKHGIVFLCGLFSLSPNNSCSSKSHCL